MAQNDDAPAFPPNAGWRDDDPAFRGLSIRDWFAGMAMTGMLGGQWKAEKVGWSVADQAASFALGSYSIADAMLVERERNGGS